MSDELDILRVLAENPEISQRNMAKQTGISLGQVNFLIKKFVKKGFVKIEGQTSKSLKYNLTPKGISEKASLTLEYIKISYEAVSALTDKIAVLCKEYDYRGMRIFVYGSNDEMMQIVKLVLNGNHIFWSQWNNDNNGFEESEGNDPVSEHIVFCWESKKKRELENRNVNTINILE